jgi:hypothetical protein
MGDRIEQPAHALSAEDFQRYPVWRFLGPDEACDPDADESFVVPHTIGIGVGDDATYLVRATYALKSRTHLPGFVELGVIGRKLEFTPGVVFAGGKAVEALGREAAVRLERILKTKDTQPVAWELDVCLAGEDRPRKADIAKPGYGQALALLVQLGRLRRMRRP